MGDLANRIVKNARHLSRWARREAVSCFRVYDHDIPEHPLRLDLYRSWPEERLYAVAYLAGGNQTDDSARADWKDLVEREIAQALSPDAILLKDRGRRPGGAPLAEGPPLRGAAGGVSVAGPMGMPPIVVDESGLKFEVHLDGTQDTGLFLDHRQARRWLRRYAAEGDAVLNLFCYTGSFSVYAGDSGARVTSVDLSRTYLDWLLRNLALNGQSPERHRLIQGDVMAWIESQDLTFDVIVCDPPTFSNSKRMDRDFEAQRDHLTLLGECQKRLRHPGCLLFSVNDRGFRLAPELAEVMVEISSETLSEDCRRRGAHRAWLLQLDRAGNPTRRKGLPTAR